METLKDLLDKLYDESVVRSKENKAFDYEYILYEAGVQKTIKKIRSWL